MFLGLRSNNSISFWDQNIRPCPSRIDDIASFLVQKLGTFELAVELVKIMDLILWRKKHRKPRCGYLKIGHPKIEWWIIMFPYLIHVPSQNCYFGVPFCCGFSIWTPPPLGQGPRHARLHPAKRRNDRLGGFQTGLGIEWVFHRPFFVDGRIINWDWNERGVHFLRCAMVINNMISASIAYGDGQAKMGFNQWINRYFFVSFSLKKWR